MSVRKKCVFYIVLLLLLILGAEISLHAVIFVWKKDFLWHLTPSEFNIRQFTKKVPDTRYVTIIPDFKNSSYREEGATTWDLETDAHGFRQGTYQIAKQGENFVFLGDSIPFGWGVNSADSVPSQFGLLLQSHNIPDGIINAAVPSYSLDQAIQRFKYEVAHQFNVSHIILQAYDPASQFALMGKSWDTSSNWTTQTIMVRMSPFEKKLMNRSAIYNVLSKIMKKGRYAYFKEELKTNDSTASTTFVDSINHSLDSLLQEAPAGTQVLLLTAAAPKTSYKHFSAQRLFAVELMAKTLKAFAEHHSTQITFLDTQEIFKDEPDEKVFLDSCCHLSAYGAQLEAKAIFEKINFEKHEQKHMSIR